MTAAARAAETTRNDATDLGEDRQLPLYRLSLVTRPKKGDFYVTRATWWVWGGRLVSMNGERVSGFLEFRDMAAAFCRGYTAEHPGCATDEVAMAAALASREEAAS